MQQAINKNLPTYKKVLADRHSKSLELQSHCLTVACKALAYQRFTTSILEESCCLSTPLVR
jgi:hypothetical protein